MKAKTLNENQNFERGSGTHGDVRAGIFGKASKKDIENIVFGDDNYEQLEITVNDYIFEKIGRIYGNHFNPGHVRSYLSNAMSEILDSWLEANDIEE